MLPWLGAHCGNEHSLHAWGREARAAVEQARASVAELLAAEDPSQIVFTSGATEGNNAVIAQFDRVVFSQFEHSSIREAALARPSWELLPPTPQQVRGEPEPSPQPSPWKGEGAGSLVCQMAVSNETGEIFALPQTDAITLVDATQAVGKVPFRVGEADFVTISGHKFGGPKGVGALYIREPESFTPLLRGGGHERGLRSGTLNVPGIVGLGVAAQLAIANQPERFDAATRLRQAFIENLDSSRARVNGAHDQSPFIVSVTCFGWLAEALVVAVDNLGFGISAGAACGSENPQASPGHLARGMTEAESRSTVRVSFGPGNTEESAGELARCINRVTGRGS